MIIGKHSRTLLIAALLAGVAAVTWWGANTLVARQMGLVRAIELGDCEAVDYICRWDPGQLDALADFGQLEDRPWGIEETQVTPAFAAAWLGRRDVVKILLRHRSLDDLLVATSSPNSEDSMAAIAAALGHTDLLKFLLDQGEGQDQSGRIDPGLLQSTVRYGHVDATIILLQHGAAPPAGRAAAEGRSSLLWMAYEARDGMQPTERQRLFEILVAAGAEVDPKKLDGYTRLHLAAASGSATCVDQFLQEGDNPDSRTLSSLTPLHLAGSAAAVEALVKAGADVDSKDPAHRTPLHHAEDRAVIRALVKHGADLEATDVALVTPLLGAANLDRAGTVRTLVELGAGINARDNQGRTALHLAARRLHLDTLRALIELGADPKLKDDCDRLPVDVLGAEDLFAPQLFPDAAACRMQRAKAILSKQPEPACDPFPSMR